VAKGSSHRERRKRRGSKRLRKEKAPLLGPADLRVRLRTYPGGFCRKKGEGGSFLEGSKDG